MPQPKIIDLADCTDFRQTLAARPPAIVHGTVLLLLGLIVIAVTWAAIVQANLVVRAQGRVRPLDTPTRVFTGAISPSGGRVVEAHVSEGDTVRQGDVLVRLDTEQLDNRIGRLRRTIQTSEEELIELDRLDRLVAAELESARRKAIAELDQAADSLAQAQERQASNVRRAKAELKVAEDHFHRLRKVVKSGAATEQELVEAASKVQLARENHLQAQLPVDDGQVAIRKHRLDLLQQEFAVRLGEVQARRVAKLGEAEAVRKELANLQLQKEESVLRAPLKGIVVTGRIEAGDVLEPGKPVMEIASQQGFRFEATVPSEDVAHLEVGMPVRIKFDAYDYQKYGVLKGSVSYVAPDSRVAKTNGQDSVPAYLVRIDLPVREIVRGDLRGEVKLGLGGTAEIVTGRESLLSILLKKIRQTISLG